MALKYQILILFVKYNLKDRVMEKEIASCSKHEEKSNAYWVLVRKPEGKRPLERSKYR
jgi:hypothetical protein